MYYIAETDKPFEQASTDLESAVKRHGFAVLHLHDLGSILRSKGMPFSEQLRVFEICHPGHASRILGRDLRLNMALPCRISVYTEQGQTKIGLIRPLQMLEGLSRDPDVQQVAQEVEEKTILMVDEAKGSAVLPAIMVSTITGSSP